MGAITDIRGGRGTVRPIKRQQETHLIKMRPSHRTGAEQGTSRRESHHEKMNPEIHPVLVNVPCCSGLRQTLNVVFDCQYYQSDTKTIPLNALVGETRPPCTSAKPLKT